MAGISEEASIFIHRSPDNVWSFLIDPKNWKDLPLLRSSRFSINDQEVKEGSYLQIGIETMGVYTDIGIHVTKFDKPVGISWEGHVTYMLFRRAFWPFTNTRGSIRFEAVQDGTKVTVSQNFFPSDNVFAMLVFLVMERVLKIKDIINNTMYVLLLSFQLRLEENLL